MPANTPKNSLPYPLPTEPVAEGAQAIRNLAEALDLRVVPFGAPIPWVAATIPAGYVEFDGRALTAGTYPKLFALYGATLPDLRNRFLLGASAAKPAGTLGGAETHTLAIAEMPSHIHGHYINFLTSAVGESAGMYHRHGPDIARGDNTGNAGWYNAAQFENSTAIRPEGGGGGHNNMPPFQSVTWITAAG